MIRRLRLRRSDGRIYLDRYGIEWKPLGGIFLHKMSAPDPGFDLHDHPWPFVSIILKGGYTEKKANIRDIDLPHWERRYRWSIRSMRIDEAHQITSLHEQESWSLVLHGRGYLTWGFHVLNQQRIGEWRWVDNERYFRQNAGRRQLRTEIGK